MAETLYIIDGHSQIYRAYYAPFRALTSSTGEPTRATYVFCSMMLKFFNERSPKYIVMAADGPTSKLHRKALYSDYKATRRPGPDDLEPQIARIMQIVAAMRIPILTAEGYEADDIIATLVERYAPQMDIVLVSRDKDLDQILRPGVVMFDPLEERTFDAASVKELKGYTPEQAVEVQTLAGDAIDNVPGIDGVGVKTAAKLINQYGSIEALLANADKLTPKLRERLLAGADTLKISRQLVTLDRNVPLDVGVDQMQWDGLTGDAVRPIFAELGFNRLLDQLDQMGVVGKTEVAHAQLAQAAGMTTAADFDYQCADTPEKLDDVLRQLQGVTRLAVDTETTCKRPMWCELVGISLAWRPGHAVYLPVKGPLGETVLDIGLIRDKLGGILADPRIEKIGQNLKYDVIALAIAKMDLRGPLFDTMVAAYVLDSSRPSFGLDALSAEYLNHRKIPTDELLGRGKNQFTMDRVPCGLVSTYACEDADMALRLADVLQEQLAGQKLLELFHKLEMPLLPVLADMEMRGIAVDPVALKRMQVAIASQAALLRDRIIDLAGCNFNPDSPKQLADVLFGKLGLPPGRSTKSGPSTDVDVLEQLATLTDHPHHDLPALMLDYRRLQKLLGTYCVSLGQCIHPCTGRIHTSFNQTGAATGRLSSSDPNLQNIPIRTEEGRQIRSAFVADEGYVLLGADYSQVEIRMLAHLCGDETLMEGFRADQDIHRIVAAEVFGVSPQQVTGEMRGRAKTVNFGIIYGQTAFGLALTLRISRTEAGQFITAYRKRFPKIGEFLQQCIQQARAKGYVETIFGRRRYIPEIDASNPQRRSLAERLAINSVVQGSAADLIKKAMVNIDHRIRRERRPSKMLLQIHDELVFEVPVLAVEGEQEMIVHEMTTAVKLDVPLKVEVGTGTNWMDAK